MDRLTGGMLEASIGGKNNFLGDIHCPFPALYQQLQNNETSFLSAARLFAVLYLRLSNTVKHVLKLDFKIQEKAQLSIKFEGQRPSYYSNVEPHIIKFKGTCSLMDEEDDD